MWIKRKINSGIRKTRRTSYLLWQILTTKRPHISYIGWWAQTQNLGDKALFEAVQLLFSQCGFIEYPYETGSIVSASTKMFGIIKCGLLSGGTLIIGSPRALKMAKESFPVCKNTVVFGTGVADPSFWAGQPGWQNTMAQWKPLLERCCYIGARGPISARILTGAGINNVEVLGDPILALADDLPPDNSVCLPKSIGFNIGRSFGNVWGTEDDICSQFVKLATLASNAGWKVRWFVVVPDDLEITKTIAKATGTDNEIYTIYTDHQQYLDLVRPMSIFVGMKLHAVALATCAYVPSMMLEYRPKCRDYMSAIGQEDATIRTDEFQADKAWETIQQWNGQREVLSKKLFEAIKPIKNNQFLKAAELLKLL